MINENNIVEHWIKAKSGNNDLLATIASQLSELVGTRITASRLGEWRRGDRSMPRNVQRAMLAEALPCILTEAGIKELPDSADHETWLKLADAIMPPQVNSRTR